MRSLVDRHEFPSGRGAHQPISTYIPATLRPCNHPTPCSLSLQIGHFGAIAQLAERLDRTQEVGGSNPPSSIDEEALQTGHIGFRGALRTGRKFSLVLGTSAQSALDMRGYAPIPRDYGLRGTLASDITDGCCASSIAPTRTECRQRSRDT